MKTLIFILLLIPALCFAQVENIKVVWSYTDETPGVGYKIFKFVDGEYLQVADISDPSLREWSGDVDLDVGENLFAMTAYDTEKSSPYSPQYPLQFGDELNTPVIFSITFN